MELMPCKQEDCKYFSKWRGDYYFVAEKMKASMDHIFRCLFCSKFTRKDLYAKKED